MKREILNFSKKISDGVNNPTTKFVMDMQYGLAKSCSCLISNVARSLDENIKLNYTIDYSSYKARLITANEIATITGNTSWDETKEANSSSYYVHDNSETLYEGTVGTNKYAWLFDNTYDCTTYGCNVADSSTYGYWTASSRASYSLNAWNVYFSGRVSNYYYVDSDDIYGVRPVIEVLRTKLS